MRGGDAKASNADLVAGFSRFLGIDYSGARTPVSGLPGIRIYRAENGGAPVEVRPPVARPKHWTRRGAAEWLMAALREGPPTLVGIDHALSFPVRYFEQHDLPRAWPAFLEDFCRHWPTDNDTTTVDDVRRGRAGQGLPRKGDSHWRRITDQAAGSAKSVFHFDVQGSVAKSTHAGLPWIFHLRLRLGERLHVWPFDGWDIPEGRSAIAEIYPSLWRHLAGPDERTPDQHDAYVTALWLSQSAADGRLNAFLAPPSDEATRVCAEVEGWILGVRSPEHESPLPRTRKTRRPDA